MRLVSLLFHDVFAGDPHESGFVSPGANRYKLSMPEFDAQLEALSLSRRSSTESSGAKAEAVRLTFDDGGISYYTIVADRLEALGVRAYCFISTDFIGQPRFLNVFQIRDLDSRGHLIGTHSASHPARFSALESDAMRQEWSTSRRILEDIVGHTVAVGSVPGGYFSNDVARAAAEAGLQLLFNSEPVISTHEVGECTVAGRFTIRRGAPSNRSGKLTHASPWTRSREWAAWNAKGLIKPLLGTSYPRVADWALSVREDK
jgi:peptidoglycan/xylan/chitin deacetylase (PgdA/CDA1 family)